MLKHRYMQAPLVIVVFEKLFVFNNQTFYVSNYRLISFKALLLILTNYLSIDDISISSK